MRDVLVFKDYCGTVHYSTEDEVFFGKIEGIDDLVTFEGNSVRELKASFEEAVNDYIDLCQKKGKPLQKTCKGSFNVRLSPELHSKIKQTATQLRISLNQFVTQAVENELSRIKHRS